ncbi:hypothetical protein BS639_17015 [Rouxiella silvae]|uniref:Adenylate cyclase n=1 Tax=Rouxiella silvae TaxID=1646373 RepID=A0ABX3TXQ8_9GAMM|nr:hypothetical protein [Rouxiella silvae]ORJ19995.1 hypothetical protein BS639_17015 [Rouxiella silvae]
MHNSMNQITYRNGFQLNGQPATVEEITPIFEKRRAAALTVWEEYEQNKAQLRQMLDLSPEEYQRACRQIADALGI